MTHVSWIRWHDERAGAILGFGLVVCRVVQFSFPPCFLSFGISLIYILMHGQTYSFHSVLHDTHNILYSYNLIQMCTRRAMLTLGTGTGNLGASMPTHLNAPRKRPKVDLPLRDPWNGR